MERQHPIARAAVPYVAVVVGLYMLRSAWASILLYHAGILAFLLTARPRPMPLRGSVRLRVLLPAVLVCLLAGPALYGLWPLLRGAGGGLVGWLPAYGLRGRSWPALLVYFALVHPVMEEIHWRAPAQGLQRRVHWQDAAFAGYHVPVLLTLVRPYWLPVVFGVLVAVSATWRAWSRRRGGLAFAVLTHTCADVSVALAAYLLVARGL